jgi:hypothetical protein
MSFINHHIRTQYGGKSGLQGVTDCRQNPDADMPLTGIAFQGDAILMENPVNAVQDIFSTIFVILITGRLGNYKYREKQLENN